MKKRNLVICPNCRIKERIQVLGEVDAQGHFLISRFHNGITKIVGREFAILCGGCGELVYIKRKPINPFHRFFWFSQSLVNGTVGGTASIS